MMPLFGLHVPNAIVPTPYPSIRQRTLPVAIFEQITHILDSLIWTKYLFFLLLGCGLLFSITTKFVQWRALTHGIAVVRGKYDREEDAGQISHFQALCAALSATIGLGNIAGVGVAVSLGGPGAVFWMWIVGFFGMAIKFVECSLATMFRDERDVPDPSAPALMERDAEARTLEYAGETPPAAGAKSEARGEVRGGPMWYIQKALVDPALAANSPWWVLFKFMAVLYATVIAIASFGGGNMFQSWNVGNTLAAENIKTWQSGIVIAFLVSLVIIGGIKRIGNVAGKLVPAMCIAYVGGAMIVLFINIDQLTPMLALIIESAFSTTAGQGAFAGTGVYIAFEWGLRRALFSNEAGQGSAAIAHAAAKTDEPVREGVVAAIGPFVDTIIICTMTALVILSTGVWNRPPVGTIHAIDKNAITIAMTAPSDIPDNLREGYVNELQRPATRLEVFLDNKQGKEPTTIELKTNVFENKGEGAVLTTSTFDAKFTTPEEGRDSEVFKNKFADLTIGQPVHLKLVGAEMTRFALDTAYLGLGRWIVLIGVCLFAFSTMISWSYYGEKGVEYLFGPVAILPYKILFVLAVYAGCTIQNFEKIYSFSDAMTGFTVICNLPACLILLPTLIRASRHYFKRLDGGEMKPLK